MIRAWHRPLAALWALWFVVVTTGAGEIGACKVHGPGHGGGHGATHVASASVSAHQQDAHPGHHMPAQHATKAADLATSSASDTEAPAAPASCSCVGDCCMITPATLPAPTVLELSATATATRTPTPEYRSVIALRRAFAQPYAIGPPTNPTT